MVHFRSLTWRFLPSTKVPIPILTKTRSVFFGPRIDRAIEFFYDTIFLGSFTYYPNRYMALEEEGDRQRQLLEDDLRDSMLPNVLAKPPSLPDM